MTPLAPIVATRRAPRLGVLLHALAAHRGVVKTREYGVATDLGILMAAVTAVVLVGGRLYPRVAT